MAVELLFYHLKSRPLEAVLPALLEKSLERGWRAVVQSGSEERLAMLDAHLWSYRDDSFLPHGLASDRDAADQPVLLTTEGSCENAAQVWFLIDGADLPESPEDYDRIVLLFDGNDEEAVETARRQWKAARELSLTATYWLQDEQGRWRQQ